MKKTQTIAIVVALLALGALYFVPTKKEIKTQESLNQTEQHDHDNHDDHDHESDSDHSHISELDQEVIDAVEIIQNGGAPMAGIQKLLRVIEKDPNHLGALRQLGFMSMQTGQYEKAVNRFSTIVEVNPEEAMAYYMLAQAYEGLNDKDEAITAYNKYVELEEDETKIEAVKNRIKEFNNN